MMMDPQKRKALIFLGGVFISIVVLSFIAYLLLGQKNDLPPVDDSPEDSSVNNGASSNLPTPSVATINGISLAGFSILREKNLTDDRISATQYYLAEYAQSTSGRIISFTLDEGSIRQDFGNELKKTTFNVTTNTNEKMTIEVSYIYSADNFVQIFDNVGKLVQSTPTEAD